MKKEMYKTSLKLKTVDELVDIILRKDDKEKEKNKLISNLERRICNYKKYQDDMEKEMSDSNKSLEKVNRKLEYLKNEVSDVFKHYNAYKRQNSLLRLAISGLGAIAIVEFLALILS